MRVALRQSGPVASLLLVGTVVAMLVAVVRLVQQVSVVPTAPWLTVGVYTLTLAVGEMVRVEMRDGHTIAPIGMAAGTAAALTMARLPGPVDVAAEILLITTGLAVAVAAVVRRRVSREPTAQLVQESTARVLIVLATFGGYLLLERLVSTDGTASTVLITPAWADALLLVALTGAAAFLHQVVLWSTRPRLSGAARRTSLADELVEVWPVSAVTAIGAVIVTLMESLGGPLLIPLSLVPVMLMQAAVHRQAEQRITNRQTLWAIGRVTEVTGFTPAGHASRVAMLAVLLGRDLGMSDRDLRDLEAAALLHDIGQVGLSRPIPGGATTEISSLDQRRISMTGGGILARTEELSRLATVVSRHSVPYRAVEDLDHEPLASRIIKVANAWDDLNGTDLDNTRRRAALARVELSAGSEYDPEVVRALRRVLERRGLLHPVGTGRRSAGATRHQPPA